jgi:hypothetical protein
MLPYGRVEFQCLKERNKMKKTIFAVFGVMMLGCLLYAQRPYYPWVERVCIYDYPRQIKVALHQDLWLLYDYPYCTLHMAWQGGSRGGVMRNANYVLDRWSAGPHTATEFDPEGQVYFNNDDIDHYYPSYSVAEEIETYYTTDGWNKYPTDYRPWKVRNNGQEVTVRIKYKGYFIKVGGEDRFQLNFSLVLPDGKEIGVTEVPEHTGSGAGLSRTVTITGIPAGHEVRMHLRNGGSVWQVSGQGQLQGEEMIQNQDGASTVSASW